MTSAADVRNEFSFKEAAGYFLISAFLVSAHAPWPDLVKGALSDPDSYTRIVWLNDMLERSDALHRIVRDGSGDGTIINWTHLLSSVVYLLALPLSAVLPMKAAIHVAAVMFGPISVGLLGALAAWSLAPITETRWRWLAAVAVGVSAPVVNYGGPGVADHHTALAAVAVGLAGCAGRVVASGSRTAAVALGAVAGVGVWLSPEALPFIAMSFGACVLPWIFAQGAARREAGKSMTLAGGAFVALLAAALLIDPPLGGYAATDDDRLSIVYLALSFCLLLSFGVLFLLSGAVQNIPSRMAVAFGAISLPLLGWVFYFSSLSDGFMPFSSNEDVRAFFEGIEEMAPLTTPAEIFCYLTDAILATMGLAWFAYRSRSVYWLYAVGCLIVTIVMGALHRRFLIYTGVAAAAALPLLLDEVTRLLAGRSREALALARISLVALTLMPNRVYAALGAGGQAAAPPVAASAPGPTCNVREFAPFLQPFAGEVVMASVNDTPPLLYHTRILTVGSMGHRGLAAVKRLTNAWLSGPSESIPDAVRATRARFLLICRTNAVYKRIPPDALFARLQRGETPVWAKEEINDPATGFVLFRILGDKSAP